MNIAHNVILLIILIGLTYAGKAFAIECPRYPQITKLNTRTEQIKIDYNFHSRDLEKFQTDYKQKPAGYYEDPRIHLLGLAVNNLETKRIVSLIKTKMPNGEICLSYHMAIIDLLYRPQIYIAKESAVSTECLKTVRAHEEEHIKIAVRILADRIPKIRESIEKFITNAPPTGPIIPQEEKDAGLSMQESVDLELRALIDPLVREINSQTPSIDTKEEEQRTKEICRKSKK